MNLKSDKQRIIDDTDVLQKLSALLQSDTCIAAEFSAYDMNTTIELETDCDLSWSCLIEKRENETIHLIFYNQKSEIFQDYDVTEIMKDLY